MAFPKAHGNHFCLPWMREVEAVGSSVQAFKPGDKIMGFGDVFGCGAHAQYFVLPESLSEEHRREFHWKRANPFGSLMLFKRYPTIGKLAISFFLIYMAAQSVQGNWNFFTMYRFNWSEKLVGISLAVVGLLVGVVQAGLTRVVNPRLGNERSIYLGLILYTLGLVLFAFATESWMMFVFLIPYCLGGIAGPSLQSVLAGHVPPNEQGELQGALTSLMSLTTILGPIIKPRPNAAPIMPKFFALVSGVLTSAIYAEAVVKLAPVIPAIMRPTNSHPYVGANARKR